MLESRRKGEGGVTPGPLKSREPGGLGGARVSSYVRSIENVTPESVMVSHRR